MSDDLAFEDLLAPVRVIVSCNPLEAWRWLVGPSAEPILMTACGDLFVVGDGGRVFLVDTYGGTLVDVAPSYEAFKLALQSQENLGRWFMPDLIVALRQRGIALSDGQCYSPKVHPVLGGEMVPENFEATDWTVHFVVLGQIHEQVNKLPPGTQISGIDIEWKQ